MIVSDTDAIAYCGCDSGDPVLPMLHLGVEKAIKQFLRWNPVYTSYTEYYPKGEPGGADDEFVENYGSIPRRGGVGDTLQLQQKFVRKTPMRVFEQSGAWFGQATDADFDANELTYGEQWVLELDDESGMVSRSGKIIRVGRQQWPKSRGSVKVVYVAGFSDNEFKGTTGGDDYTDASDIRLAVLNTLGKCYNEAKMHQYRQSTGRPGGLVASESIPGYSYSMPADVAMAMAGNLRVLTPLAMDLLQPYRRYGDLLG